MRNLEPRPSRFGARRRGESKDLVADTQPVLASHSAPKGALHGMVGVSGPKETQHEVVRVPCHAGPRADVAGHCGLRGAGPRSRRHRRPPAQATHGGCSVRNPQIRRHSGCSDPTHRTTLGRNVSAGTAWWSPWGCRSSARRHHRQRDSVSQSTDNNARHGHTCHDPDFRLRPNTHRGRPNTPGEERRDRFDTSWSDEQTVTERQRLV